MKYWARGALVLLVVFLPVRGARADKIVYFKTGKAIVVSAVEERGGWLFLNFVGGGVLGVPEVTVRAVQETELAQEIGGSFGNTIQAPDVSRRTGRVMNRRPVSGQRNRGRAGSSRQGIHRGSADAAQRQQSMQRPGQPGTPAERRAGPYGLIPLDLSGNKAQGDQEDKEKR